MMRIKEAIQRRRLIQELNDEWLTTQLEAEQQSKGSQYGKISRASPVVSCGATDSGDANGNVVKKDSSDSLMSENQQSYLHLVRFVNQLKGRLSDSHLRALRVTWNRLTEPPKTSGRGILRITEKVFDVLVEKNPNVMPIFYRSAFIRCINRQQVKRQHQNSTIVTLRDHAHLLIELVDGIICIMFDAPMQKPVWDIIAIGKAHANLIPFGFNRSFWHTLGEVFAEVMFGQECVRAYPQAASAWSTLIVAVTDKMYRSTKTTPNSVASKFNIRHSNALTRQLSLQVTPRNYPAAEVDNLSFEMKEKAILLNGGDFRQCGYFPATTSPKKPTAKLTRQQKNQMLGRKRKQTQRQSLTNKNLSEPQPKPKWWQWNGGSIWSEASTTKNRSIRQSRRRVWELANDSSHPWTRRRTKSHRSQSQCSVKSQQKRKRGVIRSHTLNYRRSLTPTNGFAAEISREKAKNANKSVTLTDFDSRTRKNHLTPINKSPREWGTFLQRSNAPTPPPSPLAGGITRRFRYTSPPAIVRQRKIYQPSKFVSKSTTETYLSTSSGGTIQQRQKPKIQKQSNVSIASNGMDDIEDK